MTRASVTAVICCSSRTDGQLWRVPGVVGMSPVVHTAFERCPAATLAACTSSVAAVRLLDLSARRGKSNDIDTSDGVHQCGRYPPHVRGEERIDFSASDNRGVPGLDTTLVPIAATAAWVCSYSTTNALAAQGFVQGSAAQRLTTQANQLLSRTPTPSGTVKSLRGWAGVVHYFRGLEVACFLPSSPHRKSSIARTPTTARRFSLATMGMAIAKMLSRDCALV